MRKRSTFCVMKKITIIMNRIIIIITLLFEGVSSSPDSHTEEEMNFKLNPVCLL